MRTAEVGFAGTRISDICRAARVTRPVFYEIFDGKEDAFLAAHRYGTSPVFDAMDHAHAAASDWPGRVRAGLGALLGILAEAPAFATMAIVEIDAGGRPRAETRARRCWHVSGTSSRTFLVANSPSL
ncbi:TetR/AcrR family transcriptional regulator [Streptomyces sp. NPDC059690]|uniref:TetR/AcrR family transcriptional regulator n=1 Tax=Streptomyces sp. NPDC059690 TaxID=3346907 RepID=UPI0036CE0F0B